MKLTKGALTMLLAQYRAIYKNAFIKGLASAALATAVLASGSASATEVKDANFADSQSGDKYVEGTTITLVPGDTNDTFVFTKAIEGVKYTSATNFNIQNTTVTFDGQKAQTAAELNATVDKNFSLEKSATLNISSDKATVTTKLTLGKAAATTNVNLNGTINIANKGTLEVLAGGADAAATKLNLDGATINNAGTIDFKGTKADLSNVTALTAGSATGEGIIKGTTLKIKQSQVEGYLDTAETPTKYGQIQVGQGILTITQEGEESFDVNKFYGAEGDNKISVDTTNGGTIKTTNALIDGAVAGTANKLTVDADNVTVGKVDVALEDLKVAGVKVGKSLTLNSNADATIVNAFTLAGVDNSSIGQVDSANKLTLGQNGKLEFTKGNWDLNADVEVGADGTLTVANTSGDTVKVTLGDGKTLTVKKDFVVGATSNANTSVLDVSKGTFAIDNGKSLTIKDKGEFVTNLEGFDAIKTNAKTTVENGGALNIAADLTITDGAFKDTVSAAGDISLAGTLKANSLTIESNEAGDSYKFTFKDTSKLDVGTLNLEAKEKATFDKIAEIKVTEALIAGDLTLNKGKLVLGDATTTGGELTAQSVVLGTGAEAAGLTVNGTWNFNNTAITLSKENSVLDIAENSSITNGGKLTLSDAATLKGKAEFESLATTASKLFTVGDANRDSHLTITGTKDNDVTTAPDLKLDGEVKLEGSTTFEIGRDALDEIFASTDGVLDNTGALKEQQAITSKIELSDTSVIKFDFTKDDKVSFTADKDGTAGTLKALKDAFKGGANQFKGFINIGDASIDGLLPQEPNATAEELKGKDAYTWESVKDLANVQVTTNKLENAIIEVNKNDKPTTDGVSGNFGAFFVNDTKDLKIKNSTILQNAAANTHDGVSYFVSKKDRNGNIVAANVNIADKESLALKNSGVIGKVTGTDSTLSLSGEGLIKTSEVKVKELSSTGVNAEIAGKLTANTVSTHGSNVVVSDVVTLDAAKGASEIAGGSFVAKKGLTLTGDASTSKAFDVVDGAKFSVEGKLTAAGAINVGRALDEKNPDVKASSATMFVEDSTAFTGKLNLESDGKKATLAVFSTKSPTWGTIQPDAVIKPETKLARAQGSDPATPPVAGTQFGERYAFNHDANLGEGTVAAYGFKSEQDAISALEKAKLLKSDLSLESGVSAVAMFNVATELADNKNVNLNSEDKANAGAIKLGKNSVIAITDRAFLDDKGGKTAAAITSKKVDSTVAIDKDAQGNQVNTKVVLAGNFSAQDANLHIFGENLKLADGQTLFAESANGLLKGEIGADGTVNKLEVQKDKVNNLNASYPVKQYILKFAKNEAEFTKKNADTKLNELAQRMALGDTGVAIEQSARFAVYGGSVKAAELASKAGTDAIKSYTKGTANVATAQTATGSIFVVPTYKSSDSDSFNAEGVDFGSDIKLSGVALGADYMVAPNVKVGAMFNVGTGDADGKGIASGFETDLDYVGCGLFLNYNQDALNITADLTYTQSSADMNANVVGVVDANKMTADVDTSAISLGVQGSYKFDLDGSYATPYAGMRLTKYDIDSYTVQVDGKSFMDNDADTMTVFSIPVGVELGTQMTAGDWTVEPSLDLGVTFNLGDTDLTHSATAVTKTSGVNLTSEVLDDVVFGIKGALKANYNGLSLGLGLGYEVGSNADDLSVQATGVYTF